MTSGQEFIQKLETRFAPLSPEEKLTKIVETQKRLNELKAAGYSEEEAVALLDRELPKPITPEPEEDYGSIHHPKKPLLTGVLYVLALAAVLACAALLTRLFA
jgi:hypothetical protein